MSAAKERLVRNQILFREVNERLEELADPSGTTEFLCECSNEGCTGTVELTIGEYEGVRSDPTVFVVRPDHELLEVERVVDKTERFVLVEKAVRRDLTIRDDPRARAGQHAARG